MEKAIKRIEALLMMEKGRPQRDAAGVCIPMNMDASVREKVFEQCLQIMREEGNERKQVLACS